MLIETKEENERAILVAADMGEYDLDVSFDELEELAKTADVETVGKMSQKKDRPEAGTYLGKGKLEELGEMAENLEADLLIFDTELTMAQIKNIEAITKVRTIDRTMLILDIFSEHATTKEGRLQVGLARQKYMLPRLKGMGITLSRLGGGGSGGAGARRGAGETKLETDRRYIRERINIMEKELKELEKRREFTRESRRKNSVQTVAIVGYTNVGKSTLINKLTDSDIYAEDKLFATLDPTVRQLALADGRNVVIIDTVGLIRRLPHHLVKAFHSTIEEATNADLILNVCDASSDETDEQIEVTNNLMKDLGASDIPVLTVYNKWDKLDGEPPVNTKNAVSVSAKTGEGLDNLLDKILELLPETTKRMQLLIPYDKGSVLAEIRKDGNIFDEEFTDEGTKVDAMVDMKIIDKVSPYEVKKSEQI